MARVLLCAAATALGGLPLARAAMRKSQHLSAVRTQASSLSLATGTPCSPLAAELSQVHLRGEAWSGQAEDGPRFFLLKSGRVDFQRKYVSCMDEHVKASTELDKHINPAVAEHMIDGPLLQELSKHPKRVWRVEDADLVILGEPLMSSFFATANATANGEPGPDSCGRRDEMHGDVLQYLEEIVREGIGAERKVLAIATDWTWRVAFGRNLTSWATDIGITLGAVDHLIPMRRGGIKRSVVIPIRSSVVIPYRSHYLVDKASRVLRPEFTDAGQSPSWKSALKRSVAFTFHGRMDRNKEGAKRALLLNLTEGMPDVSVRDFPRNEYTMDEVLDAVQVTAETVLKSAFCLIPAGDSPSTRRLFDALAAGCVPIIFQDLNAIADNLPFRRTVDWSEIALFAGSLDCLGENIQASRQWLQSLLSPEKTRHVLRMRGRGREAYRRYMSYQQPVDVSTALFREFKQDGSLALPVAYFEDDEFLTQSGQNASAYDALEEDVHYVEQHWRWW